MEEQQKENGNVCYGMESLTQTTTGSNSQVFGYPSHPSHLFNPEETTQKDLLGTHQKDLGTPPLLTDPEGFRPAACK